MGSNRRNMSHSECLKQIIEGYIPYYFEERKEVHTKNVLLSKLFKISNPFLSFQLSEEVGYVLYSALGSFYVPSCIMVFVYIRIYFAAKARARRGIRKIPRRPPPDAVTSFTTKAVQPSGSVDRNSNTSPRDADRQIATIETLPQPIAIPTVTCDFASDISTCSDAGDGSQDIGEAKDTLKVRDLN